MRKKKSATTRGGSETHYPLNSVYYSLITCNCSVAVIQPCAPLDGNLGMDFIEALCQGRGRRGPEWDKPRLERLGECIRVSQRQEDQCPIMKCIILVIG